MQSHLQLHQTRSWSTRLNSTHSSTRLHSSCLTPSLRRDTACISTSTSGSHHHINWSRCMVQCAAQGNDRRGGPCSSGSGRSSRGGSSGGGGKRSGKYPRKAREPGMFEVEVVVPPKESLGIYALPPLTHNGEQIEIDGQGYVVTGLVLKYKLVKGKYVREHNRLEVQPTGRYFVNMMLDNLIKATYVGPTGNQD